MTREITAFTAAHVDPTARLYTAVFNGAPWNDWWTLATARKRLTDARDTPGFLGYACFEEALVGFVLGYCEQWFDGAHFYLKEICVDTDRQRAGIGTRLLQHLECALTMMGVSRVYLLTMRDGPAARFYAKNGYYSSPKMGLLVRRL